MSVQSQQAQLLSGAVAIGDGPIVDLAIGYRSGGFQVRATGGGTPTVKGTLYGSLNYTPGANGYAGDWFAVATFDTTGGDTLGMIKWFTDKPCAAFKFNLGTLSGGSSPAVSVDGIFVP